jgi:hydrophobic/amphiphilic exporter-1 (mainly G- bacteria), HAE1 family
VTLALFGVDLNMYAFVGIVMLVGIVKKNAIMMIDFAIEAQRTESKRRSRRYSTRASPASGRS